MSKNNNIVKLYILGIQSFNDRSFYEAHDFWEELWVNYKLNDPKFIQALIQLSVGFFHVSNYNRNGALGLLNKSKLKFIDYAPNHRGQNILSILKCIDKSIEQIEFLKENRRLNEFNWDIIIKLNG